MRAYTFRLQSVLRVRAIEVIRARQRVAVIAHDVEAAKIKEVELEEHYASASSTLGESAGSAFIAEQERGTRLAEMLSAATNERTTTEARLLAARCEAAAADQRVRVLERLDERRRAEWLMAAQRADASELDDFATIRAAATTMGASRVD